jgi:predicted ribonuclease toxin of YeeF-YezG toxin-antitoxin module
MLKSLWTWIAGAARAVWTFIGPSVKQAAKDFINDKALQAAALAAVKAAAGKALKGDDAWTAARGVLLDQLKVTGQTVADNWVDTLLQNAYFAFKNGQ